MIKIAFFWHQHQPYYKDNLTGEYSLPWVRLHGIKDYIGMALLLKKFPTIRQTFNYVPCLLDQLKDYGENRIKDRFWKLSEISVADLTEENKLYILDNFFSANHQNMIDVYPRYKELLHKRNFRRKRARDVLKDFSNKDFQDLQVWANLTWYHPLVIQRESLLTGLMNKGEGFTQNDKEFILSKQREIIREIIPLHKQLQDSKQIEITTSPYYHPILPLLCNQESAKVVLPNLSLPRKRFKAVDDAKVQVEKAVQTYEKYFNQKPRGMWPSEGAVSDDIIPILTQAGFHWLASDEEILSCSLDVQIVRDDYGDVVTQDILYKPYRVHAKGYDINMVFRDHNLSDLIGFHYSKYHVDTAVSDFTNRINSLKKYNKNGKPLLVTIILDGENAWEYYPNSGLDFLSKLYEAITQDSSLECVCIGDYLKDYPPEQVLHHICPGSWIGHNLATWIGHEEKNVAWEFIEDTRAFIVKQTEKTSHSFQEDVIHNAYEEIFIAEGSDWFWWFGDDYFTQHKYEFDNLFRMHLKNVYKLFNVESPRVLDAPISRGDRRRVYTDPKRFLDIKLDGIISNYFEWLDAGKYNENRDMDTMHRTCGLPIHEVYFGFNVNNLFIRVDFNHDILAQYIKQGKIVITFVHPSEMQISTSPIGEKPLSFKVKKKSHNNNDGEFYNISFNKILELSCSFSELDFSPGIEAEFFIEFMREDALIQRVPLRTVFCFTAPSADFERIMWQV